MTDDGPRGHGADEQHTHDTDDVFGPGGDEAVDAHSDRPRFGLALTIVAVCVAAVTLVVAGLVVFGDPFGLRGDDDPTAATSPSAPATPGAGAGTPSAEPSETPSPTPSGTPSARPATAAPTDADQPDPTVSTVPAGTVVAEGDVTSPKGSVSFHYRMVADGANGYDAQYSGFSSSLPVPVSLTLIDIAPRVGDGLTSYGVGAVTLDGASRTVALGTSQPSYLGTLVTYSSAGSADGVPVEIGPDKVLAVDSIGWSIPPRQSNIAPVDSGAASLAAGTVTSTTASGAPRRYEIAANDTIAAVAQRFGISVAAVIYLNAGLQVLGDDQVLFEGTTLNLDPDSV
ncbi:LysM peptidoglycan-binding domain-containing protein [Frigoribacterium faeni]|uniref:LysM repeat protein n=1 Tax=Frigoribacterium faeni TaxID=145483 RepID=A0A7W3PK81_9MICO|nr:LysM domain-containing protein [Frigoribacterium faeni]MBA8814529.1 LysM repeat protein [Frigoribacterium faeni]GEK84268.1 hypothetical protein FFA01_25770 [Frigoribacterium faeni]